MKRTNPRPPWLAWSLRLGASLALAGFYAPALQAQPVCEDVSGILAVDLNLPGSWS